MGKQDRTGISLAMVTTTTTRLPAVEGILAAAGIEARKSHGFLQSLVGRRSSDEHRWINGNLVLSLQGANLAVSLMPAPIPWSELEGPCATAWWWREAAAEMREHKFHVLIALAGGSIEPIERRVIVTRVASAVLRDTDSVGIYWGDGTLVHSPTTFQALARDIDAQRVPPMIWVDVRIEKNRDGSFRCFTTGMSPLGFLEIEVRKSTLAPKVLLGFITDTTTYIINGRKHIKDGETMGPTATERYKVRHVPSMYDRGTVMELVMM